MQNIKTNRAIIFARVSSREQEESGYSLPAQEKLMSEYAYRKVLNIIEVFSISESASGKKQRESFIEMIKYVKKNNISNIICEKVDRLTRNFKDAVLIDEWLEVDDERKLHLVKDSLIMHKNSRSQEKLNWGIRIIFAKNYTDNLSEEVKKGQKEKLLQGWLPNQAPFGYKSVGEKGHKIHIIDEPVAKLIRRSFEIYAKGNISISNLVEKMHDYGLRTKNGKKVLKSIMARMLNRPYYCGDIEYNGEIYPGKHEPIVTRTLFNQVQKKLTGKTTPKINKHFFLFKGIVKCAECNCTISWETQKGHIYGRCHHYKPCSQNTWSKEQELEDQILKYLDNLQIKSPRLVEWFRKALKESHEEEAHYHNSNIEELNKRYDTLQNRLDKMYEDKLDTKITEEYYNSKFKEYKSEQDEIIQKTQNHTNANTKYFELGASIYDLSQKAKEVYLKTKTTEEKRELLNLVFENFTLDQKTLNFNYSKPFEILSRIAKKSKSSKVVKNQGKNISTFEPQNIPMNTGQNKDLDLVCPSLRRERDSNPRRTCALTAFREQRLQPTRAISPI